MIVADWIFYAWFVFAALSTAYVAWLPTIDATDPAECGSSRAPAASARAWLCHRSGLSAKLRTTHRRPAAQRSHWPLGCCRIRRVR
jgi:hypothetical protein